MNRFLRFFVSNAHMGAFLSEGLASSAIVAYAPRVLGGPKCLRTDNSGETDSGVSECVTLFVKVLSCLKLELELVEGRFGEFLSGRREGTFAWDQRSVY